MVEDKQSGLTAAQEDYFTTLEMLDYEGRLQKIISAAKQDLVQRNKLTVPKV